MTLPRTAIGHRVGERARPKPRRRAAQSGNSTFVSAQPGIMSQQAICVRLSKPTLLRMLLTWALTVATLMNSAAAFSVFDKPLPTARTTSVSRSLSAASRARAFWR